MKRLKLNNLMMVVAVGLGGMVMTQAAEGTMIRHTFGGSITQVIGVPQPPWEGAGLGSTWEFSYVFDTEGPDLNPGDSREGFYLIDNGIISVDGVELFATGGFIEVLDGFIGIDEYTVSLSGTPLGGGNVFLTSPSGTLASDAIPVDFVLPEWNFMQLELGDSMTFFFRGDVLSFTSTVVPGLGGWELFLLGSNVFVLGRRRRTRG